MIRTRSLELLEAEVDSRTGRRVLVKRKGPRWLVCHVVSKPSTVSSYGTAMICVRRRLSAGYNSHDFYAAAKEFIRQHC